MSRLSLRPISYRHVVFPDTIEGGGRALNLTPPRIQEAVLPPAESLSPGESDCVRWLFEHAGLDPDDYRPETIKRRIPACLRALRIDSVAKVRATVQTHPTLLKAAISALVIGVTGFFRDPAVFAILKDSLLPETLMRTATPRIWSAGCSDGAELYSVAMLLADRGALQRSTLLGTDCRSDALARAREGCYDQAAIRNIPAELLGRYMTFSQGMWQVHPYLRTVVQWRTGNVMTTSEPGVWNLILCRNMAIYLQPSAMRRLWVRLEQNLRPGGVLVLGKAERPHGTTSLEPIAPGIYRRNRS